MAAVLTGLEVSGLKPLLDSGEKRPLDQLDSLRYSYGGGGRV